MDLIVYDKSFTPVGLIDTYESLIWTDRLYQCGDFEICLAPTTEMFELLKKDYYIWNRDAVVIMGPTDIRRRLMIIEGLEIDADAEDGSKLIVTGRSLESLLDRRIVWKQTDLDSSLQYAIKRLINENVIECTDSIRRIPNFIFEESTNERIAELKLEAQYTGDNLYDVLSSVCEDAQIGFTITLNDNDKLCFNLYAGLDRSYEQTVNPYVCFSPQFENIINSNYKEDISGYKNITRVGGEGEGDERRFATYFIEDMEPMGMDRREHFTDARDLSSQCDNMFDEGNPNAKKLYINTTSRTYTTIADDRLVYVEIEPRGTYSVRRTNKFHMRLGTSALVPSNTRAITNIVDNLTTTGEITAGAGDSYLAIQIFTNDDGAPTFVDGTTGLTIVSPDNQFNSSSYLTAANIVIDAEDKHYISGTTSIVYLPIKAKGEYKVTRSSYLHMILATCTAVPANGGIITNVVPDLRSYGTIEAGPSDTYLAIQVFTSDDESGTIAEGITDLSVTGPVLSSTYITVANTGIDLSTSKYKSASTNRMIYIPISSGSTYRVSRTYSMNMYLATSPTIPSSGGSISVLEDNLTTSGSITAGENDHYLAVQVFDDEDLTPNLKNGIAGLTISGPMLSRDYTAILKERGSEKLLECKSIKEFESEIDTTSQYVLGEDFDIGDYVQIVNEYGIEGKALITEIVRSQDSSGISTYPAFVIVDDEYRND